MIHAYKPLISNETLLHIAPRYIKQNLNKCNSDVSLSMSMDTSKALNKRSNIILYIRRVKKTFAKVKRKYYICNVIVCFTNIQGVTMKKYYAIRLEELDTPRQWWAGKICNYLIREKHGIPHPIGNEVTGDQLKSLLKIRRYHKIKQLTIFTLWNLGFRGCQIARMTGLCKSSIYYHINRALSNKEMKDDFMCMAFAISIEYK